MGLLRKKFVEAAKLDIVFTDTILDGPADAEHQTEGAID
jgi:hypothetical protein